jgi:hypothetical protein
MISVKLRTILLAVSMLFIIIGSAGSNLPDFPHKKELSIIFWVSGIVGVALNQIANHIEIKKLKKVLNRKV